jgi:hypothetical protein
MNGGNPNTNQGGVTYIPAISTGALFINGKRLRDTIQELISQDQFEQSEIDEIKLLLQYLNTSGLSSEWIVDNNNKNQDLKTSITALQTKLAQIDTTALTLPSVLTNDNRNSVLKTRLDGHDGNLGELFGKTRYVSSVIGSNTAPKVASDFQVSIADREKRRIYMTTGANQISMINDSTNQATQGENTDNQIIISAPNGMVETTGYLNSIRGGNTIEITGYGGMGVQTSPNIKIGNKGAQILIGSEDTPEVGQTNTVIKIGKRDITKNTETQLRGNIKIVDARFDELSVSQAITWTQLGTLIPTAGIPAWVIKSILTSSIPNYVYSDFLVMKGNITKDGDLETTTMPKMKGFTVYDSSVTDIDILPKVQTFLAKGDISSTQLKGSWRTQVFGGDILLRNGNCAPSAIDWGVLDALDRTNALKISNGDVELIAGAGGNLNPDFSPAPSQMRISNTTTNGKIRFRMGTDGLQSNAHDALAIYNDPSATTSQVLIAGNNVPTQYDTTSKLLVDHQFLNNGIKVAKQGQALITRINNDNINTPSLTLQTNYTGPNTTNSLYLNASNQLMYNGTQVGSGTGGTSTGGIIYLLRGPTTSAVYTAANLTTQILTAGESYVGSAQKSIKLTTYNAGTTYNIYTHRGTINKITNPVIKGIWEYVINLSYSGNQPANVYVDANFFGDVNTGSSSVLRKIYAAGDAVGTGSLGVGQDSFTPYWVINKYQFQFIFTSVEFPLVNYRGVNCVFRCTLEDDLQTVLYTFPDITRTSASSGQNLSVESLNFTAPSQQTITQGFLFTGKKLRFRFRFVSGTSSGGFSVFYNQPDAAGVNNLGFRVPSPGSYSTPLSLNNANIKALQFDGPLMREYKLSVPIEEFDLTLFENPKFDLKFNFTQPSGTTSNHFIEAFFNDGSLSHCHTALNITSSIPSLQQVMAVQGDTNTNMYFYGGAGIQNVSFITDTLGITYSVKAITAGAGINVSSTPQGIYTISATGGGGQAYRYYNGGNRVHKVSFNLGSIDLRTNQVRGTFKMRIQNNISPTQETTMIFPIMHFNTLHSYSTQTDDSTDHTWVNHSYNGSTSGPIVNAPSVPPRTQLGKNPCFAQVELVSCGNANDVPWIVTNFTINLLHDSSTGATRGITCDGNWHYTSKTLGTTAWNFQQGTYSRYNDLGSSNFLTHLVFGSFIPYNTIGTGAPRGIEYADLVIQAVPIPTYTTQTS